MTLGQLIERLERADKGKIVKSGFNNPHSYMGYYEDLAFEPCQNISVLEMLECARSALGQTFEGYKGGEFRMDEHTEVHIACYGCCGDEIGPTILEYMLE